jgi:quinoprotein glucose dehydrogenase
MHLPVSIRIICCLSTPAILMALASLTAFAEDAKSNETVITQQAARAAKAIQLPKGFTLTTVASEPNLANGVAFCFDPAGRIFVAETYRVKKGVEDNRDHMDWLDDDLACRTVADRREYLKRRKGDKIGDFTSASEQVRLLVDANADGLYEKSSIFSTGYNQIEDGAAAGVLWDSDRLWFTCIPSLYELRDADGDGVAEEKRTLATGFGVHFALYGHDLHGLIKGPDGKIYFSIGDRGLNVDTPRGKLYNPDSGAVLRCNPDGSQLEFFATGLRNPQELAFNEFGDLFTVDNNSDSGDKARLVHIVEGMDAGWRMPFQYLDDRGPFNREKIWHLHNAEQPASIVPPLAHITKGPSGLVHYPGTGLPAKHKGAFFIVDFLGGATGSGVREFHVQRDGATYKLTEDKPLVTGVLATDCDFGPDGNLYILDWVEGWNGPGIGRIHRVSSDDAASKKQRGEFEAAIKKIPAAAVAEAVAFLDHANMRVRSAAQERLVVLAAKSIEPLKQLAAATDASLLARLHAIWALGQLAEADQHLFSSIAQLCSDEDAEIRAQAARTLSRATAGDETTRTSIGNVLEKLLDDPSPRVRRFAAISLGTLGHHGSLPTLVEMAGQHSEDPTLRNAIVIAMTGGHSPEELLAAAKGASDQARLVLAVALGRQKSPLIAQMLDDLSERVVLEAARAIWDAAIPAADENLAALLGETTSKSDPLLRRVLAANLAGRTTENLERVIDFACDPSSDPTLRDRAWGLVRTWASPSPRDSVNGDWRPLVPQPAEEVVAAVQKSLPKFASSDISIPLGIIVAAELGIDEAFSPLLAVVGDESLPKELRVRAIAAFGNAKDAATRTAIDAGVDSKSPEVRAAARKLWSERFPNDVVDHLADAAANGTTTERQAAIDTLAGLGSPKAAAAIRDWMAQLETGQCPPELQLEVQEAAAKSNDAALRERHKKFADKLAAAAVLDRYAQCLTGGDADRGRKIFETNDTIACRRCHSVKRGEVLVGPCLAEIGGERKPIEILESIVAPNAKIREGFETAVLELDSGQVVTGVVRQEDKEHIELVDAEARKIVIDAATVESRIKGKSPMPENIMEQMNPRDLRDLVAYLSELKPQSTRRGRSK